MILIIHGTLNIKNMAKNNIGLKMLTTSFFSVRAPKNSKNVRTWNFLFLIKVRVIMVNTGLRYCLISSAYFWLVALSEFLHCLRCKGSTLVSHLKIETVLPWACCCHAASLSLGSTYPQKSGNRYSSRSLNWAVLCRSERSRPPCLVVVDAPFAAHHLRSWSCFTDIQTSARFWSPLAALICAGNGLLNLLGFWSISLIDRLKNRINHARGSEPFLTLVFI